MSSSTDNKTLIYNTLKSLNTPTEGSKPDFFNNNDELYVPESFSAILGGVIPEQDIQDVIDQIRKEKQQNSEKKANGA